jgi:hypothetical protein
MPTVQAQAPGTRGGGTPAWKLAWVDTYQTIPPTLGFHLVPAGQEGGTIWKRVQGDRVIYVIAPVNITQPYRVMRRYLGNNKFKDTFDLTKEFSKLILEGFNNMALFNSTREGEV